MPNRDSIRTLVMLGTRPEAVKMLPVIQQLRDEPKIDLSVVFTGQHKEMVEQILGPFGIVPDANLEITRCTI